MPTRDSYTNELADTVSQMFASGITDPSAEEIAQTHFALNGSSGLARALGGEIVEGIRKRLSRIAVLLEEQHNHQVCLLNIRYYSSSRQRPGGFRRKPPTSIGEAQSCLPIGYGMAAQGIWLSNGVDDLIYRAAITQNMATGAAKTQKNLTRAQAAVTAGHISRDSGEHILDVVRAQAAALPPQRPPASALTGPEDDDPNDDSVIIEVDATVIE